MAGVVLSGWGSGPGGLGDLGTLKTLHWEPAWPARPAPARMLGANLHGPLAAQEARPGGVSPQHQPCLKWRSLPENQPPLTSQEPSPGLHRVETLLGLPSALPIKSQPCTVATKHPEGSPCPPPTTLLTLPLQLGQTHSSPLPGVFAFCGLPSSSSMPRLRPPAWPLPAFLPQKPDHLASNPMTVGAV